jgi:hypothetical protein
MSATMTTKRSSAQRELKTDKSKPTATGTASQFGGSGASIHEEIARLAYALWEQRGCPSGSAEFDWFAAEEKLLECVERPGSSIPHL